MRKGSGDGTKERLREAAADLFSEKGYAVVTVQEIVERAGVTKGAFYHHYNGKEDVYFDFFEEFVLDYLDKARSIADSALSPRDALAKMIHAIVGSIARYRRYCSMAVRELRLLDDPRIDRQRAASIQGLIDEMVGYWAKTVQRGIDDGSFRMLDSSREAAFGLVSIPAFVYGYFDRSSEIDVDRTSAMFADLFLDGLTGKRPVGRSKTK